MKNHSLLYRIVIGVVFGLVLIPWASAGQKVNQTINLGGNRAVTWYLPDNPPNGWVFLQHGFQRNKNNLDAIATHYMDNGLMVLTANSSVTGGNASLARSIADAIMDSPPTPPAGFTLPNKLVLSGHSAGGLFVSNMGARLVQRGYGSLAGMLLFDPVDANNAMGGNMQAVINSGAPVLAILANANQCNSSNNALNPLRSLSASFVGIRLSNNSKHFDVEGASGGGFVTILCGGSSQQRNIDYVQEFGYQWTRDMIAGNQSGAYYPGGSRLNSLLSGNDAVLLKDTSGPVAPVADFSFSVTNLSVSFQNQSDGSGSNITAYNWDFGNGISSSQASPNHTYAAAGTYSVTLTVTNANGLSDVVSKSVTVTNPSPNPIPPVAEFAFSADLLTVSFSDQSSDTDGRIVSRQWNFGDGSASSQANPVHAYAAPGSYSVTLTVTDNTGLTDASTRQVSVSGASNQLQNGVALRNLSGGEGQELSYFVTLPARTQQLRISIVGGTGDADVYVKRGQPASVGDYDYRPYLLDNNETVVINSPASGTWHVMVRGYEGFSGVTLLAEFGASNGEPATSSGSNVNLGSYQQVKAHNNQCMTVQGTPSDGAAVELAACSGNASQWRLVASGQLQSRANPAFCLTSNAQLSNNQAVFLESCRDVAWHQWDFKEGHLINRYNKTKALEAVTGQSNSIVVKPLANQSTQKWTFGGSLDKLMLLLGMVMLLRRRNQGDR